jgi:hypothetical protein
MASTPGFNGPQHFVSAKAVFKRRGWAQPRVAVASSPANDVVLTFAGPSGSKSVHMINDALTAAPEREVDPYV